MREIDYGRFEDKGFIDHLGLVGKGASLLFEKGIYEGSYLRAFMDEQLKALGVETFGDLRVDDPGASPGDAKGYRLVVMTSDVTRARLVRLPWDYETYGLDPDTQRVADAVRASMSIPFFYEPVRFTSRCRTSRSRCSTARTGSRPDGRRSASSSRPSRMPRSVRSTTCTGRSASRARWSER